MMKVVKILREACDAGFGAVDIDMSKLVDYKKQGLSQQQEENVRLTAYFTLLLRSLEDKARIAIGGEVGEIGGTEGDEAAEGAEVGSVEEMQVFYRGCHKMIEELMKKLKAGKKDVLPGWLMSQKEIQKLLEREILEWLIKIAAPIGTEHGEGVLISTKELVDTIDRKAKASREMDAVFAVHAFSLVDLQLYPKAVEVVDAGEVHLGTRWQDIAYKRVPKEIMEQWEFELMKAEPKRMQGYNSQGDFINKEKKRMNGLLKEKMWGLDEKIKEQIRADLYQAFVEIFRALKLSNTLSLAKSLKEEGYGTGQIEINEGAEEKVIPETRNSLKTTIAGWLNSFKKAKATPAKEVTADSAKLVLPPKGAYYKDTGDLKKATQSDKSSSSIEYGVIKENAERMHQELIRIDRLGYKSALRGVFGPQVEADRRQIQRLIRDWKEKQGVRLLAHLAVGGQALGSEALLNAFGPKNGYRVKFLGDNFGRNYFEIFGALAQEGYTPEQIALHVSSIQGHTDESVSQFQHILRHLIRWHAIIKGLPAKVSEELIAKVEGHNRNGFNLTAVTLEELALNENQKDILRNIFSRTVFSTRLEPSSRLYLLASSRWLKELMGSNIFDKDRGLAIPVFAIPDNIVGRYSVRSPSGDITSEFAGIDTSRFNKGARHALDKYLSDEPEVNIALEAALEVYSINPCFLNVVVPSWKLMAFGDHLAQLIPENDSKSNKGQVVKVYLERLMDKAGNGIFDNKTVTIKIIVGGARSGGYFEKDGRILVYALADYSEEELAKMFFFFEEFTVMLGLFYIGEETGDIYSESFLRADPLTQGFVELGKAVVARFATEAAAKNTVEGRYREYEKKIGKGPLVEKISLFTSKKEEEPLPDYTVAAIPKEAVNISDEALLKAVKEIEVILNQEFVSEADEARLARLLESIKGYGRGRQGRFIEDCALTLARLAFYAYKKSKLIWPLFYGSNLLQQKALGLWYKYIAPALSPEFGVGTTRQDRKSTR